MTFSSLFPERFDGNEWFIIIGIVISYSALIPFRKRFPSTIFWIVFFYAFASAKFFDIIFAFPPFDFYDMNDSPKFELMDMLLHFLYPPFSFFFVYFYDRWNIRGISTLLYIVGFSGIGVGFEALGVLARVYSYKHWNLLNSFTAYLFVQGILVLYFKILKSLYKKTKLPTIFEYQRQKSPHPSKK